MHELYRNFGRHFIDDNCEIIIGGEITDKAIANMKNISFSFAGHGKSKLIIRSLDTTYGIGRNFKIEMTSGSVGGKLEIGRLLFVNQDVEIVCTNAECVIEDDVMIAKQVLIYATNHHSLYEFDGKRRPNKNLYIGKHVWLGYRSTVYAGAVIGDGTVIGASSVVAGKLPNNCVAVGNPARVVRKDVFWQTTGSEINYYDLPEKYQEVDEYIGRTID